MNNIISFYKVGDKESSKSTIRDGVSLGWVYDINNTNLTGVYAPIISDHTKKVFCCVSYPSSYYNDITKDHVITFSELEQQLNIPNLESDLRGPNVIDIIDGNKLTKDILKPTGFINTPAKDLNAISGGSWTVGTAGDYTTFSLAFADIANLSSGLTFTQISNITETAVSIITETVNYTFEITSNKLHYGNPTNTWIITRNINGRIFQIGCAGTGIIKMHNLYLKGSAVQNTDYGLIFVKNTTTFTGDIYLYNNLLNGGNQKGRGISIQDANPTIYAYNNIAWNYLTGQGIGFFTNNINNIVENNTAYDCATAGFDAGSDAILLKNNVAFGNGTDFTGIGSATGSNNADSDGTAIDANWSTGSANITGIISSNEFKSITDTTIAFMKLHNPIGIAISGIAPSIADNISGIRNNPRGVDSTYSIGADEYYEIDGGNYNIGGTGDYRTFGEAFADISGNLTTDLTFQQIANITETDTSLITGCLNNQTFTITSDTSHYGNPTAEYIISFNGSYNGFQLNCEGPGSIKINHLYFKQIGTPSSDKWAITFQTIIVAFTLITNDILLNNNSKKFGLFHYGDATPIVEFFNTASWDSALATHADFDLAVYNVNSKFENLTIHNATIAIRNQNCAYTYRNLLLTNCAINIQNNSNSTGINCATNSGVMGFATNTNCITGIILTNEFITLDDTNADFLKVKNKGVCYNKGTTLSITGNTLGIRNNARPGADGLYSIGADEYKLLGGFYPGILNNYLIKGNI